MDTLSKSICDEAVDSEEEELGMLSPSMGSREPNSNRPISPLLGALDAPASIHELTYFDLRKLYLNTTAREQSQDLNESFQRVKIVGHRPVVPEAIEGLERIRDAVRLRSLYVDDRMEGRESLDHPGDPYENAFDDVFPPKTDEFRLEMQDGVFRWGRANEQNYAIRSISQFLSDLNLLMNTAAFGPSKTLAYRRLKLLESRFDIQMMLNGDTELQQQKAVPHRDFYNIRKIDNHIHHSACMNQKHLLRFIKKKLRENGDEEVIERDGKVLTLKQVFDSLNLNPYDLSVDALNMHAREAFHRFDKFNLKYNPIGETRLREIFLKTDNYVKGRYLAEVTKEVFSDLIANKYQYAEYRLSIYGKNPMEWAKLSSWICDNRLSCSNVQWMIQIPRLYSAYKKQNLVDNFQQLIDNIFAPLFEATLDPAGHPEITKFLRLIVGFDSVDDESIREFPSDSYPTPSQWNSFENPPFSMWAYYMYANLKSLNALRKARGMNTFAYRPHSGEAGDIDHLGTTFLLSRSIAHGILLKRSPVLQYLYYLTQIGISMSPLSNNLLFVTYAKNPFPKFFARGLNVTLSSDDPLIIHYTKEPLLEEYSVAAQVYKFTAADLAEIARNSVLQSGFDNRLKAHWIGSDYLTKGEYGNDVQSSNVPDIRIAFRQEVRDDELNFVFGGDPVSLL